jgi:hypothetical protein
MKAGDTIQIDFNLENSDIVLQFRAEVVHRRKNYVGVKFVFIDSDTFIHLRNFLDVRSRNPQLVSEELMNFIMTDAF